MRNTIRINYVGADERIAEIARRLLDPDDDQLETRALVAADGTRHNIDIDTIDNEDDREARRQAIERIFERVRQQRSGGDDD